MTTAETPDTTGLLGRTNASVLLFGGAMFVSAALVFALEPMIAKMILPQLGGSPAVWNTSMMFFQIALLAGYAYAHGLQRLVPPRAQIVVHLSVVALSALVLPLAVNSVFGAPPVDNPIWWLLGELLLSIGAPFAALSATAPLLQAWYVHLQRDAAQPKNPYVLYGASNLGSMMALLAYPLFVEPSWTLSHQSQIWTVLYELFFLLIAAAGITIWRLGNIPLQTAHAYPGRAISWRRRAGWIVLAAIPSSLMLGTSTYIANDIASVPLFWVIPLALYLLTFVISFQEKPVISRESGLRWQMIFAAIAAALLCITIITLVLNLLVFLGALFFGALICHQALAEDRPHESRLTEFYLLISVGGVLGGIFNSLLAPMLFHTVLEFQLVLVLVCLARPSDGKATSRDMIPAAAGVAMAMAIGFISADDFKGAVLVMTLLAIGAGAMGILVGRRAWLFTLVIAALCAQATLIAPNKNPGLLTIRSFFGVSRVVTMTDPQLGPIHVLYHGTTIHGAQAQAPDHSCVPGTYFAPGTPIGETITNLQRRNPAIRFGVVGLGAGSIAAYTRAADTMRYFEIDPAVARIARDSRYFTFLSKCAQGKVDVVLGDARLTLGREAAGKFDLVILDAFSADNIPTHLLTREAFALYFRALTPDGVVMLHITNRNLALEGPAAATAKAAGALARIRIFTPPKDANGLVIAGSKVMVMSKSAAALDAVTSGPGWHVADDRGVRSWTDEYTNVAGALYDHTVRHLP
jgi:hypothetical protein